MEKHLKMIEYRNYLMCLACTMDMATIEYKNICKRIKWSNEKAYEILYKGDTNK